MPHYKDLENKLHFIDDAAFEHMLPPGCVQVSEEEAAQISATVQQQTQNEFVASLSYAEKRAAEYPSIGDQLDALWKGGDVAAEMLAQIQAVKAKYPKP